jgi:hypothetical protein
MNTKKGSGMISVTFPGDTVRCHECEPFSLQHGIDTYLRPIPLLLIFPVFPDGIKFLFWGFGGFDFGQDFLDIEFQ